MTSTQGRWRGTYQLLIIVHDMTRDIETLAYLVFNTHILLHYYIIIIVVIICIENQEIRYILWLPPSRYGVRNHSPWFLELLVQLNKLKNQRKTKQIPEILAHPHGVPSSLFCLRGCAMYIWCNYHFSKKYSYGKVYTSITVVTYGLCLSMQEQ